MSAQLVNPVLAGFHPDPSICRVGEDYYLITSTFEYYPGLPVHHSRDLVHWRCIGHVLDRPDQLDLDGVRPSAGLYAPTIRHHDGVFYVICTLIGVETGAGRRGGNFIVTATDPAGPWSDPHWLAEADGFDPSLFFDRDGTAWCTGSREYDPQGRPGRTEIWLSQIDLVAMTLTGPMRVLWRGSSADSRWAEAPHLYLVDGHYYLLIAEGGTEYHHSVAVARAEVVTGPYIAGQDNPVLTHRHLGHAHPIAAVGHADLVQTQHGQWWALVLGVRPYGGFFHNLGRETFLVPVIWEDGWPVFAPGTGRVEERGSAPSLTPSLWPTPSILLHWVSSSRS
jgi:xylan 1,4-beta-xylosidase